jgi:Ca-activated chloride channel family protein
LLTNVKVEFDGFTASELEPAAIGDLFAERPVVLFGKWKGEKRGSIIVRGISGEGEYVQKFAVAEARAMESTSALAYLWARHRIATLADYNQVVASDERVQEVTNLGMTYNLLTAYTSFVAVDELVRNASGPAQLVKQALPLPHGVENSAVGAQIATTPEPGAWLIVLVAIAVIGFHRARRIA